MPIAFTCPHCQTAMRVDDCYGGATGPCRSCGQTITIPNPVPDLLRQNRSRSWVDLSWVFGLAAICVAILFMSWVFVGFGWVRSRATFTAPVATATMTNAASEQVISELIEIHTALLAYAADHGTFPPAYTVDSDGKRLHSWRVLLLPYLKQETLFKQLDLSQPWDSPQNKRLLQHVPMYISNGLDGGVEGSLAGYMVVVGEETMFPGETGRAAPALEGNSPSLNKIVVVEVTGKSTHWAEPTDLTMDEFAAMYRASTTTIATLRLDGSVAPLPPYTMNDETLRKLLVVE